MCVRNFNKGLTSLKLTLGKYARFYPFSLLIILTNYQLDMLKFPDVGKEANNKVSIISQRLVSHSQACSDRFFYIRFTSTKNL